MRLEEVDEEKGDCRRSWMRRNETGGGGGCGEMRLKEEVDEEK